MGKAEILAVLARVRPGDLIVVNAVNYRVDEVADFEQDGERWKDLVFHSAHGLELALEIEGEDISLWVEMPGLRGKYEHHPRSRVLDTVGGKAACTEYRQRAKMISRTKEGTEELEIIYSVYETQNGQRWALEDWGEGIRVYISLGKLPVEAIGVWERKEALA